MALELVNTIATTLTAVVIAGTAIAALIQLRHMRAGNQISALLTLRSMLDEPGHQAALLLLRLRLAEMLRDPNFRECLLGKKPDVPLDVQERYEEMRSAAFLIGNTYDAIGTLVRRGIIDRNLFLEQYCSVISREWDNLEVVTGCGRKAAADDGIWEDFEYLTVLSRRFAKDFPSAFPKDMERIPLRNPWAGQ
jgi:hypothetical protein